MQNIIVRSYLYGLYQDFMGYKQFDIRHFDYEKHLSSEIKEGVFDIETGCILRLQEQQNDEVFIVQAYKGFKRLSLEEIIEEFGDPPTYEKFKYPVTKKLL
jgi:hypothetical protein